MEAKDLRIGVSWIQYNSSYLKKPIYKRCSSVHISLLQSEHEYMREGINPVIISSFILDESGFYWSEMRNAWCIDVSEDCVMTIDGRGNIEVGDDFKRDKPILLVHELQDFYKSLTGEELKIEL